MMQIKSSRFIILFLFAFLLNTPLWAASGRVQVILFSGNVVFFDSEGTSYSAEVGELLEVEQYPKVTLGENSRLYLYQDQNLLHLTQPGNYDLKQQSFQQSSFSQKIVGFLKGLSQPRSYITQAKARGEQEKSELKNQQYFENLWQELVLEVEYEPTFFSVEQLLSLAAWNEQLGNMPRAAYSLERLNSRTDLEGDFYQHLRGSTFQRVSLSAINLEVERTRKELSDATPALRYKALLIAVDNYDNPIWQPLDNPIRDVLALKKILITDYFFDPADVTVLKDPGFSDIIRALNKLKKELDENTHLLIYYAGHGYYPPDEEEGYWVPRDAGDPSTLQSFLPTSIILSKIRALSTRHTLLIADSCFSGSLIRKSRSLGTSSRFYRDLVRKKSRQIITSGGLEPVSDQGGGQHSVFAGQLLKILKQPRQEPLSASELALQLRKGVKNSGVAQTPEYGRLMIADEEGGEFFFVQQGQKIPTASQALISAPGIQGEQPIDEEIDEEESAWDQFKRMQWVQREDYQVKGEELWGGIGILPYMVALQYDQKQGITSQGEEKSTRKQEIIKGIGFLAELKWTRQRLGWGITTNAGQFVLSCGPSIGDASPEGRCEEGESEKSISGSFVNLGGFVDYTVFSFQYIGFQIGGEVRYQNIELRDFEGADTVNSQTMALCVQNKFPYSDGNWFIRMQLNTCLTTFEFGGSLHQNDHEGFKNVRYLAAMEFGVIAGAKF